jgi:uncharacterized protein YeaO (DUF488 family)
MANLVLKRVYEPAASTDGYRVLVDRLWPRGLSKEHAALDHWAKALAPSTELREWFGHKAEHWEEFEKRYGEELEGDEAQEELAELRRHMREGKVTLLYAAHDEAHNNAVVLRDYLKKHH